MGKLAVKPKIDLAFKKLFSENEDLLKSLLCAALDLKPEDIQELKLENTEIMPQDLRDKFCRLDLKVKMRGRTVDIEIQLNNQGNFQSRALYYWSRLFSQGLESGNDYNLLPETIVISFIDFDLFGCSEYHSCFVPKEKTRNEVLTDKMALHFFELTKLPEKADEKRAIELWLKLINAETEEELTSLEGSKNEQIKTALNTVKKFNSDNKLKAQIEMREQTLINETSALNWARREGIIEIAKKMLKRGRPVEEIIEDTGLTEKEINQLQIPKQ